MSIYDEEIKGATNSLKPTSYELLERLGESTRHVRDINESVSEIRAKIKDMNVREKYIVNFFSKRIFIVYFSNNLITILFFYRERLLTVPSSVTRQ